MSYATRKLMAGQEVVKKLTFRLGACKYTQPPFTTINQLVRVGGRSTIGPDAVGGSIGVGMIGGGDWVSVWGEYPSWPFIYLVNKPEVLKVEVVSHSLIIIRERGLFGSTKTRINPRDSFLIVHEGEVNGSCYGYSQTCSNSDSYDPDSIKELVYSSSPLPSGSIYHGGIEFKDVTYQSSEIKPGETIGSRSKLSFKILDQKDNGYDIVFYRKEEPLPEQCLASCSQ